MKKGFRILKFKKDKPIFEVQNVSKSFDGRPILKKLSLKVFPGEIVGVLGPNGCGKTTLFSMCIGEQQVDNGRILLNNKQIDQIPIHLRAEEGLGYLPQQRSVFNMSVYENVLGVAELFIKGTDEQKAITEKILDRFNLQHLRSVNANFLSGGELRRVMMARVMINNPKVIILDEPYAAIDNLQRDDISKYILSIQANKTSIIVSDHNIKNIFQIVDRAYVLGSQGVIAEGTPTELLKSSKAVESYFGSNF